MSASIAIILTEEQWAAVQKVGDIYAEEWTGTTVRRITCPDDALDGAATLSPYTEPE